MSTDKAFDVALIANLSISVASAVRSAGRSLLVFVEIAGDDLVE